MSRVLVTPRSFTSGPLHPELRRLVDAGHELVFSPAGKVPTPDDLIGIVPGCAAWLAGIEQITRPVLERASELRVIARHGVGLDAVDLDAAAELDIPVVPSTGSNAEGVAELTVFHALALCRPYSVDTGIDDADAWKRTRGSELRGRTAAVIGYGAIGSRVAELLAAFGMTVRVVDPFADPRPPMEAVGSVGEAIDGADVITLHCPPQDQPVVGPAELSRVAPGATLINTARGTLVDLDAVADALASGQLGGYGCDAYASEPPDAHPVWQHPNVVATPHLGGFTDESVQRSAAMAVDAILSALA